MYKLKYQCVCGKVYSKNFSGRSDQLCQSCGRLIEDRHIAVGFYSEEIPERNKNLKLITVYRKHWWNKWEEAK